MYSILVTLLGIESLIILASVFTYESKIDKLNSDYDELDAEFNEVYAAYCNISELAHQYKELAGKATDEAELYKDAYDSEHSAIHYELDRNEELEAEIKRLRNVSGCSCGGNCEWPTACQTKSGESKDMQYESSGWHTDPWGSSKAPLTKAEWQEKWDATFNFDKQGAGWTEVKIPNEDILNDKILDQKPYINPYGPKIDSIYGHTPYNQDWHRSQIDFE
jgi:hypothetical protein